MQSSFRIVAVAVTAIWLHPITAAALGPDCGQISRANLIACAIRQSLGIQSEQQSVAAAAARQAAAAPLLPSNPELELLAAQRRTPDGAQGFAWSARLSQEIELGGQRGLRREEAAAGSAGAKQHLVAVRREIAAHAWTLYFEIARGERQRQIAARLEASSRQVRDAAAAMSAGGVLSAVDADLAAMAWSLAKQRLLSLDRELRAAQAELAGVLGVDPTANALVVTTELEPLQGVDLFARRALAAHLPEIPEVRALQAEQLALSTRARLLRRTRIPNVTVSGFIERDPFEGQLLGGTLAVPLPLPEPLGRRASGEIAEAEALAERAAAEAERVRRVTSVASSQALSNYESRLLELEALGAEQAAAAGRSLDDLAGEVNAGRIRVRDALATEQQLVEFLRARVDAEHALCLASVLLARAVSFPLEGEQP